MSESKSISHLSQLVQEFSLIVEGLPVLGGGFHLRSHDGEDWLEIKTSGVKKRFRLKSVLHPSRRQLDDPELKRQPSGVLLCPNISAPLAGDLVRAGINHADLNGRLFLHAEGLHWDKEPKNSTYRSAQAAEQDLFAPRTTRLIRTLLAHRGKVGWTQAELLEHTQVAAGLVSRTLRQLVQERFLTVEESAASKRAPRRYRVNDFDALLERWRAADAWSGRTVVRQYSVLGNDLLQVVSDVRDHLGRENVLLTQWIAAWLRRPYTVPPLASCYVRHSVPLTLPLTREVTSGGNLWLVVPKDEGVFQETQEVGGFKLACDVQIYLDLITQGQRGPEAANELRQWEGFAQ